MNLSSLHKIAPSIALFSAYLWTAIPQAIANNPPSNSPYHLIQKIKLKGTEGWDYLTLDSAARRLYVTRGTRVVILDLDTGKAIGEIPKLARVHGVAIAPDLNRGFTSNGTAGMVTIFDLKTLQFLGQVNTGDNPDAIVYEPTSHEVFAFNGKSNNATVFDAASGKVLNTIPLGGRPEFAVADGRGQVYVNIEDTSEVVVLDANSLAEKTRFSLAPCTSPTGIAIDTNHRRLFVGCSNKLMAVVDADTGEIKTTVPIGKGVDANAFDPSTGLVFSSNGDGTLTVIHEDSPNKFTVVDNVKTQLGARTMALDLKTHNVFLAASQFETLPTPAPDRPPVKPAARPKVVPDSFTLLVFGQ